MRVLAKYDPASMQVDFWILEEGAGGNHYLTVDSDPLHQEWEFFESGTRPPPSLTLPREIVRGMLDAVNDELPERPEPVEREVRQREAGRVDRMLDAILDGRLQWAEE